LDLASYKEEFGPPHGIWIRRQRAGKPIGLRLVKVDVRQREEDRQDKEGRAVEEDAVAPYQQMKDRWPFKCHELQERILCL